MSANPVPSEPGTIHQLPNIEVSFLELLSHIATGTTSIAVVRIN